MTLTDTHAANLRDADAHIYQVLDGIHTLPDGIPMGHLDAAAKLLQLDDPDLGFLVFDAMRLLSDLRFCINKRMYPNLTLKDMG
jgi:hypothetical protein